MVSWGRWGIGVRTLDVRVREVGWVVVVISEVAAVVAAGMTGSAPGVGLSKAASRARMVVWR